MFPKPEDIVEFLEQLCGTDAQTLLQVRDLASDTGWRQWTSEDTQALCEWFTAKAGEDTTRFDHLAFLNMEEAAKFMRVSGAQVQIWLRRADNPLPNIKEGRNYRIPVLLLGPWIEDETARSLGRRS